MKSSLTKIFSPLLLFFLIILFGKLEAQERGLTNTTDSPFVKLRSVDIGDVHWTNGFWAERFKVCENFNGSSHDGKLSE